MNLGYTLMHCIHPNEKHIIWLSDVDPPGGGNLGSGQRRQLCGGNPAAIERMLQYGRELQSMSVQLKQQYGKNPANKKALQVCSLIWDIHNLQADQKN